MFFEFRGRPDAREKEYFGGIESAGREDNLCMSEISGPFQGLDSDRLEWVIEREQYTGDIRVGQDMQIRRCVGKKRRRCRANAVVGCHGKDRETERITGVDVGIEGILRNVSAAWNERGCGRLPQK